MPDEIDRDLQERIVAAARQYNRDRLLMSMDFYTARRRVFDRYREELAAVGRKLAATRDAVETTYHEALDGIDREIAEREEARSRDRMADAARYVTERLAALRESNQERDERR
jgi:hypothetical protein